MRRFCFPKLQIRSTRLIFFLSRLRSHTYNYSMFEFREAKRKLKPGGLIVGGDVILERVGFGTLPTSTASNHIISREQSELLSFRVGIPGYDCPRRA